MVAPAKLSRNFSLSPACPKETRVDVTEVPILVPYIFIKLFKKKIKLISSKKPTIIIGIAYLTGIISEATILTIIDVDVDDDCMITVLSKPIIRPANGFVNTTELKVQFKIFLF